MSSRGYKGLTQSKATFIASGSCCFVQHCMQIRTCTCVMGWVSKRVGRRQLDYRIWRQGSAIAGSYQKQRGEIIILLLAVGSVRLPVLAPNPWTSLIHSYMHASGSIGPTVQGVHSECDIGALLTCTERPEISHPSIFNWLSRHMLGLKSTGTMESWILHHVSLVSSQFMPTPDLDSARVASWH